MDEPDGSKPPLAWLNRLHDAGHWDRLIEMATRSLATDPNDADTHRHIAWAYAKTGRTAQMQKHVDFLLKAEPMDSRNHHLAAVYQIDSNQHRRAKPHIDLLLSESPNSANYHYLACIHALRCRQLNTARTHIAAARKLAPEWVAAAHLEIRMDGLHRKRAADAWNRIHRLKETLAIDPENASVLTTIGDILFADLERPREAEEFYRDALRIDPTDKDRQRKLLDSIRARSLLYRTLSLPTFAARRSYLAMKEGRVRWLFVILMIKGVFLYLAWLIVVGFFFAPAAMIYEWLVLAEVTHIKTPMRMLAPLRKALRWPLWVRMSIAASAIVGVWLLVLGKVFGAPPGLALRIMAWTFAFHFAVVSLGVGVRKLRARFGQWQEARRLRRESRVVLAETA